MKISIGIVTKDRIDALEELLDSILLQSKKPDDILIVENNKTPNLRNVVAKYKKSLNLNYYVEKTPGIANARNIILEKANGDIISFVDDDCTLPVNWVNNVLEMFKKDKQLIAIVGKSLNYYKGNFIADTEQLIYESWLQKYLDLSKISVLRSGVFVNTRNFSVKKTVIRRLKLKFDPNVPHKFEDTEFGIRLLLNINPQKEKFIFNPEIYVFHKNSDDIFSYLKRRRLSVLGGHWLKLKYPNFENIKLRNKQAIKNLENTHLHIKVLFFLERQYIRLKYIFER